MIQLNNLKTLAFAGTRVVANGKPEQTDVKFDTRILLDNLVSPTSSILKQTTCSLGNHKLPASDVLELNVEGDVKKIVSYDNNTETFIFEDPYKKKL